MKKTWLFGALGLLGLGAVAAYAQSVPVPLVTNIGPNDVFQDIVGGQPSAQSQYAPAALLGNYSASLGGNNPENILIGGDATTNLFAYATSGSSVTTTVTYGGPNRWAYWSGTNTAMTVSQDSTAADLPVAYKYAFKMARTSGQTGVVQVCMAQEVESVNAYTLQGQTAELDFHAIPGANYSPTGGNVQPYIVYGTGTDEGVNKLAFGLNGGGQGTVGWAGQVNLTANVAIGAGGRVTFAAPIPATATEVAAAICFTPVGTAGTNDYVALSAVQLTRNTALTATAGAAGVGLFNDNRAKAFSRRSQALETTLQQRYYWNNAEASTNYMGTGVSVSTTSARYFIPNPTTMRVAPSPIATVGSMTTTGSNGSAVNLTALAATTNGTTVYGLGLTGTVALGLTAGNGTLLQSNSGAGAIGGNSEL